MATPNYGYEKRQKELAKKRKKEEKLRARSKGAGTKEGAQEGQVADESHPPPDVPADPAGT
ncbi:MAG: hypothetical protein U1F04_13265 [Burkholderiaceae bacterium]